VPGLQLGAASPEWRFNFRSSFSYKRESMMPEPTSGVQNDQELLQQARAQGRPATLKAYFKLSGPGWLQSALTLGGGSLASSLYLGILSGFALLWLQPLAMLLGIVMLSAISYVTLSTGEHPFQAINRHVSPLLGWAWAIATLMANMVWCLPQFSLATSAVQQNLLPGLVGSQGFFGDLGGKAIICGVILGITVSFTWLYGRGGLAVKLYEATLKVVVALIVLCFVVVVLRLSFSEQGLQWGSILSGFIPDLSTLFEPAATYKPFLQTVDEASREFWRSKILGMQRDVMISASATAVGINMTFLLGYSLISRGWNRDFRGLAIFDLSTGMLIPFLLATSCVVIASASQFHTRPAQGLLVQEGTPPPPNLVSGYQRLLADRVKTTSPQLGAGAIKAAAQSLPEAEKSLAAMLVKRDAFNLAQSLKPLTGSVFANVVFGIGVVGMAMSSIAILMLISGFVVCEMLGLPIGGRAFRLGSLAAAVGALGPFFWKDAQFWLAVPTSIFGMALLPIAYVSFFLLMNQKKLLGENLPRGRSRILWNLLMVLATSFSSFGCFYSIWSRTGTAGLAVAAGLVLLAILVHFLRRDRSVAS